MKKLKKAGALALAILMIAVAGAAGATQINGGNTSDAPTLATSNDTGVAGTWIKQDTERVDSSKKINLVKELLSYNATSTSVWAPTFSYVYTVTPATVDSYTVTDEEEDHASGTAVTAPVKEGKTAGLKVAGGSAGDSSSAVGYLDFTTGTALTTSSAGASNTYNIELDFTGVTFSQAGVYRYQIAETLAKADHTTSVTYDQIAVKDATGTNPNSRWLDVYVDGAGAIYGYVCMAANGSVTPSTTKTNGFVTGSSGADEYYTYDLELSKDVENDSYGETHPFPFTLVFKNTENYAVEFRMTETAASGSTGFGPNVHVPDWTGVPKVKEGGAVTYTGIPAGVDVEVYETNDMHGVTYTVTTTLNGTAGSPDNNVSWGSTPSSATAQTTKARYESTKVTVDTTKTTAVSAKQTVLITNALLLISPTGYVSRFAPYALILVAGIALLIVAKRRRPSKDEE